MQQQELQEVYDMVDSIPFSRPKKNIHRDFSDGVMMAELIYHYNPKLVNLHNYPPASSTAKKIDNWSTLNTKVLKKLSILLPKPTIELIANATPGVIEELLYELMLRFERPPDEGSLAQNAAKRASARTPKNKEEDQRSVHEEKEEPPKQREPKDADAEEILSLVEKIDAANTQLYRLQELNKGKDEIIQNLEKRLEKIIFG